jgi:hypothetical protein
VALAPEYREPLHVRDITINVRPVALLAALVVGAIGAGWLIAIGQADIVTAVTIIATLVVLAVRAPGPLAALLLLVVMNGLPIVSLAGRLPGGLHISDAAIMALGLLLYAYGHEAHDTQRARLVHIATVWSACFVAWWLLTLVRTVLFAHVPILLAALYGRDFLYFAILLPLALHAQFPQRSLRNATFLLLGAVVLYAIGQTVQSLTGIALPWLVHPALVTETAGLTRLYASMNYLVITVLIFAGALLLSKAARRRRWVIGGIVVPLVFAAVLQLFRANYVAMVVALAVGTWIFMIRYGSVTAVLFRSVMVVMVAIAAIAITGIAASPSGSNVGGDPIVQRVAEGVRNVSHSTGTLGYRERLDEEMLHVLGTRWPVGLGFLHPAAHYVTALPEGAIRNTDTGVFNILMTMGLVGVLLLYAPLAYGFHELLRISGSPHDRALQVPPWLVYGGAAWIAWAVAGSASLVLLFSSYGLVLTALALASLKHAIATPVIAQPHQ